MKMVNVIAKSNRRTKSSLQTGAGVFLSMSAVLMLTSCVSSLNLFGGDKADTSLSTASVSGGNRPTVQTDDVTVRNAVTSADLSKLSNSPLPWANTTTGSAGVITAIREDNSTGFLCRNFDTTRHSYEGIASYSGQTCLSEAGEWLMTRFNQK
jgi:hypothetical protein